jgi:hypothetical protein
VLPEDLRELAAFYGEGGLQRILTKFLERQQLEHRLETVDTDSALYKAQGLLPGSLAILNPRNFTSRTKNGS